jgi:hypothetical protein
MSLGPRYVPDFRLNLGGEPAPAELRAAITGITHESALEGADRVEIGLANDRLRWLDHALLRLGKDLSLDLGYADGTLEPVFVGEIVAQGASFPAGGVPALTITAQDRLHKLQRGRKSRWLGLPIPLLGLYPLTDTLVASLIALENGLIPSPDPLGAALAAVLAVTDLAAGTPGDWQKSLRKKQSESDFDFLGRIAKENGWELLVDHRGPLGGYVLRLFSPLSHLDADVSLRYGESLMAFSPRVSEVGQVVSRSTRVSVAETKMEFIISVGWDWDRSMLTFSVVPALGPADLLVAALTSADDTEEVEEPLTLLSAPRFLIADLVPRLNERLTASGSTLGDPRILAGQVLRIEGVGEQFGGLYRVTSATHSLDSAGFQTRFELRKEIWFGAIPLVEQGAVRIGADLAFANDIAGRVPSGGLA